MTKGELDKTMEIGITTLHFHAGHYLDKTFGKCQFLHGHTYHVQDLEIIQTEVVDFSEVKKLIDSFDHVLIIPKTHAEFWEKVNKMALEENMPFSIRVLTLDHKQSLVEAIAENLREKLLNIRGIYEVHFKLFETDTAYRKT